MELPTPEEQDVVLKVKLRDLRVRHYAIELDKVAARATGADDVAVAVARLTEQQKHIELAYDALKGGNGNVGA